MRSHSAVSRPTPRSVALGVMYLSLSLPLGSWLGRVPDVKASLGASDAAWGWANSLATAGEVVGFALIMVVVGRWSSRALTVVATVIVLLSAPLVAGAPTLMAVVVSLFVWMLAGKAAGTTGGALILVHQNETGRMIFGRYDALYSLGMLAGGGLAWAAINAGVPSGIQLAATNGLLLIALAVTAKSLPDEEPSASGGLGLLPRLRQRFSSTLIMLAIVSMLASVIDSSAAQWAGIFVTRLTDGDSADAALTYPMMMAAKTIALLVVGPLAERFGWSVLGYVSVGIAVTGLAGGVAFGTPMGAMAGYAALGIGTAFLGPWVNTRAGAQASVTPSEARTMLELGELPAYLLAPTLIGLISETAGITTAIVITTCIPLIAIAAIVHRAPKIDSRCDSGFPTGDLLGIRTLDSSGRPARWAARCAPRSRHHG